MQDDVRIRRAVPRRASRASGAGRGAHEEWARIAAGVSVPGVGDFHLGRRTVEGQQVRTRIAAQAVRPVVADCVFHRRATVVSRYLDVDALHFAKIAAKLKDNQFTDDRVQTLSLTTGARHVHTIPSTINTSSSTKFNSIETITTLC